MKMLLIKSHREKKNKKQQNGREIETKENKQCKGKTIAHHQPANAQPLPEQRHPDSFPSTLYADHDAR